jgi:phosphopantothenoylcysteine decarboxylase
LHILATGLSEWADVRVVLTKSALNFVKKEDLPSGVPVYTDEDEWSTWSRIGDE